MAIQACIFDLDGVIVDSAKYHFESWKRLADELEINFTEADNEKLKGVSRADSLDRILTLGGKELSSDEKQVLMDRKNEWYLEFIDRMEHDEILPGIRDFFEALRNAELKIALGSSSKNARRILNRLDLNKYFDAIVDGTDVSRSKPDPEVFNKGSEALNIAPEFCVVVEDSNAGIEAALKGGFQAIGINLDQNVHGIKITLPDTRGLSLALLEELN